MTGKQRRKREENRKKANEHMMLRLEEFEAQAGRRERLQRYLGGKGIKDIAVYGGGTVGKRFCGILKECGVRVSYIIDKFFRGEVDGIPVKMFRYDFLPEVDAVIIVPCHEIGLIRHEIGNYFGDACRLIGLDDFLDGVCGESTIREDNMTDSRNVPAGGAAQGGTMKHSFVCLGWPKCATTTLDAILRQHPQIGLPCHKETLFFSRDELYRKGLAWYEKRYYSHRDRIYPNKIYGEVNPLNVGNGNYERNIRASFGSDTKFIYILRNPIDAVFSWWKQMMLAVALYPAYADNIITEDGFDYFVDHFLTYSDRKDYGRSAAFMLYRYGRHFATVLKYVPLENVYVLCYEDYVKNVEAETKKLLAFIGADMDISINYNVWENVGNRISKGEAALESARRKYRFWNYCYVPHFPYLGEIVERKMDAWMWRIYIRASEPLEMSQKKLTIHEKTRQKLMEYYRGDVELLDRTLKTDFLTRWGFTNE